MSSQAQSIIQQAKQRMKSGYWLNRSNQCIENIVLDDNTEEMYLIVKEILSGDQIVTNPIDRLIDKNHYADLNAEQKSHYILQVSRKYHELTKRYFLENNSDDR